MYEDGSRAMLLVSVLSPQTGAKPSPPQPKPHTPTPASVPAPPVPPMPQAPGSQLAAAAAGECGGRRQSGAAPACGGHGSDCGKGHAPPRPYPWAQLLLSTVRPATAAPSMDHVKQPAAHLLVKHVGCERLQIQQVEPRAILRSSMGR